jgi:hypothetical protein
MYIKNNPYWVCLMFRVKILKTHVNKEWENVLILNISFDTMNWREYHNVWSYERQFDFMDKIMLGSFRGKLFKQIMLVSHVTVQFLCETLGPYVQRQKTYMK